MPQRHRQPSTLTKPARSPRTAPPARRTSPPVSAAAPSASPTAAPSAPRAPSRAASTGADAGGRGRPSGIAAGVVLSVAAFVLYAVTAARYPVTGDTPELMAVAKILGVAHAPGYPLLTMVGHVAGWLPVGSYAWRLSLVTAACSAGCVGLVYALVARLTEFRASAWCAAAALAVTPVFWQWSLQFEVFGLANLLALTLAYLLVCWYQQPGHASYLIGAAFAFGLGLTNQQTIALLVPAIVWLLWLRRRELLATPAVIGYCVLALVAGLLPYMYVPIAASRNPGLSWDDARDGANLVRLLTRKDYGSGFNLIAGGGYSGGNPLIRLGYLALGIGLVVGLLAIAGLYRAYRQQRWYFWFSVLAFGCAGVLFQLLANLDTSAPAALFVLDRFLLLPLVLVAPLAGLGASQLGEELARGGTTVRRTVSLVVVVALSAAAAIGGLSYARIDLRTDRVADRYARDVLTGLPARDILLINGDETIGPVWYAHFVEGVRPDVIVVLTTGLPATWYDGELRASGLSVPDRADLLTFRQANIGRPVNIIGPSADTSMQGKFYVYQDGLTNDLIAEAVNKSTTQLTDDNNAKLASYHIPSYRTIKHRSFEPSILADYASVPYAVGRQFQQLNDDSDALAWYRRALAIDPGNSTFEDALLSVSK